MCVHQILFIECPLTRHPFYAITTTSSKNISSNHPNVVLVRYFLCKLSLNHEYASIDKPILDLSQDPSHSAHMALVLVLVLHEKLLVGGLDQLVLGVANL